MYVDESIQSVMVFGDWHGNANFANRQAFSCGNKADIYLHVGDFGLWNLNEPFVKKLERTLSRLGKELWFIDGNHENFDVIAALPKDERGLSKVTDHIFHVPRGFKWQWGSKVFLGVGGAVSIDVLYREVGKSWWAAEQITEADVAKACAAGKADVLVTHETPVVTWELDKPNYRVPDYTIQESELTRKRLLKVLESCGAKLVIHGHHHKRYETVLAGGTKVVGLDRDILVLEPNRYLLDVSS